MTRAAKSVINSRPTIIIGGIFGLFLAYLLGSLAFDSGSWWHYFGTLIILVVSIRFIARGIKARNNG